MLFRSGKYTFPFLKIPFHAITGRILFADVLFTALPLIVDSFPLFIYDHTALLSIVCTVVCKSASAALPDAASVCSTVRASEIILYMVSLLWLPL